MKVLLQCLAIGSAGFFGAIARYLVALMFGRFQGFPFGTMVINLSGSLFLGWFAGYAGSRSVSDMTRLAIGVGFVGAYTTFSTFMYESYKLADDGAGIKAIVNIVGSLTLGMIAVWLGAMVARWS
jgi:CrcB protein